MDTYPAGPTGVIPVALVVRDMNSDAKRDVVVANGFTTPGAIGYLRNTGGGTFGAVTTMSEGASTFSVAIGDFNADGFPDLVMANAANDTCHQWRRCRHFARCEQCDEGSRR